MNVMSSPNRPREGAPREPVKRRYAVAFFVQLLLSFFDIGQWWRHTWDQVDDAQRPAPFGCCLPAQAKPGLAELIGNRAGLRCVRALAAPELRFDEQYGRCPSR